MRIAEIDLHACVDLETRVLSHLSSLVPSQRLAQFLRQGDDRAGNGVANRLGTVSAEGGSVFHTSFSAGTAPTRQVQEESEAARALHQGADCGTAEALNEVPSPVARHGAIGYRRR